MPQVCGRISTGFLVVAGSGFGNSDGRVGQPKKFLAYAPIDTTRILYRSVRDEKF